MFKLVSEFKTYVFYEVLASFSRRYCAFSYFGLSCDYTVYIRDEYTLEKKFQTLGKKRKLNKFSYFSLHQDVL